MNTGDILIRVSLIATAGAMAGYVPYLKSKHDPGKLRWGRLGVYAAAVGLLLTLAYLWTLILTHRFEFDYVSRYSSRTMPRHYLITALWGGQEGTFLLWAALAGVLSVVLRFKARAYEAAVQFFYLGVTLFLLLMLTKASPFRVLAEVPPDGQGLNPLLQDPWMTIHPPITFFGFAALGIPAAFAMAALVRQEWDAWVPRALPWSIFGVVALGAGLTLGGYWSYSILGWGGYWGWDPVENSSLVPWLIGIALIHTQVVQLRQGRCRKLNLLLALLPFVLLTYSTFLTRSGVLADFSVHSFTDLGINQFLVAFMTLFLGGGLMLYVFRWRRIPRSITPPPLFSRENFLAVGSLVFLAFAAVVCLGTSAPILSRLWGPASAVEPVFYNTVVLPFALIIALLMGVAPHLVWQHVRPDQAWRSLRWSAAVTVVGTAAAAWLGVRGILLAVAAAGVFALVSNLQIAVRVTRRRIGASGGYWAHVGVGFMILGVLASTGYDRTQVVELPRGEDVSVLGYTFRYLGNRPVEGGLKTAHDIQVTGGRGSRLLSPTMYVNSMNGGMMKKPAIAGSFTHDVYVAPGGLRRESTQERTRRGVVLERGVPAAQNGGTLEFLGFEMTSASGEDAGGHGAGEMMVTARIAWSGPDGARELRPTLVAGADGLRPGAAVPWDGGTLSLEGVDASHGAVTVAVGRTPLMLAPHAAGERDGFAIRLEDVDIDIRPREALVYAEVSVEGNGTSLRLRPGFVDRGESGREFIEAPIGDTGKNLVLGGIDPATHEAELYVADSPQETLWVEASTKPLIGWLWLGTALVLAGMATASVFRGRVSPNGRKPARTGAVAARAGSGGEAAVGSREVTSHAQ